MAIADRIPDLSDKELESLHANAVRLQATGTAAQREQAEALLPLLGAAMDARKAARGAVLAEARKAGGRKKGAGK